MTTRALVLVCSVVLALLGAMPGCSDSSPADRPLNAGDITGTPGGTEPNAPIQSVTPPQSAVPGAPGSPSGLVRVFPVAPSSSAPVAQPSQLRIGQGQFFSYALPEGWRVGEDGQFALSLVAPDNNALTVMVGNAGFPTSYPAGQFVFEKLSALAPQNLQIAQPRQSTPISGFAAAYEFDVSYVAGGVPSRGLAKAHIAPAYDSAVYVMTFAASAASQWPAYSSWLPLVAEQISATNGAAFGARGIMAQNLQNSTAYAEAARQYREWSQRTQQQVTSDRNASVDQRNQQFREALGGVQTYQNPFGFGGTVELPNTFQYYWSDPQGNFVGTNDPGANPNVGSTVEWRRLAR